MPHGRTRTIFKKILLLAVVVTAIGVSTWYYRAHFGEGVYEYSSSIDRGFILNLFKEDWYWLISDYSKDYSPERTLDLRAPSKSEEYAGKLIIKTYRIANKPAAFAAYFTKELFEGEILFLAVGKKYRKKGIARKLMLYTLKDLKRRGVHMVRLLTRTDNVNARKLYESLGFERFWTDGAYVRYKKELIP